MMDKLNKDYNPGSMFMCYIFYLLMSAVCPVTAVDSTVSTTESLAYLVQFGYLSGQDTDTAALRTEESFVQALKYFQKMAGIEVTGKLDKDTKEMMEVPRCGNKDNVQLGTGARRRRRYALQGSKWGKRELTFKISEFPRDLASEMVEREVQQAFKVWSEVTPLNFTLRTFNERVDIDVKFTRRHHGDGNPFDGRGRTLAHAFFPQFGGDVHFDDDEDWTINISSGVNMFQVAAHEFGHSLGLSHSDVSTAIMAPFYRGFKSQFHLDKDDISAIQEIYGARLERRNIEKIHSSQQPTRGPVLTIPKICTDPKIDAITMDSEGTTYIFKGTQYYRLNSYGIDEGYPKEIEEDWKGITGPIDSALHWDNGYTYIFKGNFYWKFYNFKLVYVNSISEGFKGIPSNIDAAFVWGGNGKTYFIKGDQYWRYAVNHVDPGYPKSMSVWTGLPSHIDAALKWKNGRTYFFSGNLYYRYNDVDFTIDTSYPRDSASWWLGCPDKQQINQIVRNLANTEDHSKESDKIISQSKDTDQIVSQSKDRDQIVNQSHTETQRSIIPIGQNHNEQDTSSEQFYPVVVDGDAGGAGGAGQVDFLQEDENNSAAKISSRHTICITIMAVTVVLLLVPQTPS